VGYNPNYKWINPTYPIYNWGYNPLTKWDEPPSTLSSFMMQAAPESAAPGLRDTHQFLRWKQPHLGIRIGRLLPKNGRKNINVEIETQKDIEQSNPSQN